MAFTLVSATYFLTADNRPTEARTVKIVAGAFAFAAGMYVWIALLMRRYLMDISIQPMHSGAAQSPKEISVALWVFIYWKLSSLLTRDVAFEIFANRSIALE